MNQTKIRKFSIGNNLKEVLFKDLHFTKKVQAGRKFMVLVQHTKAAKQSLGPNNINKFSNLPSHMDHKATLALDLNKEDHEDVTGNISSKLNQDSSILFLNVPILALGENLDFSSELNQDLSVPFLLDQTPNSSDL